MAGMRPDTSQQEVLQRLTEQAQALFGPERASALRPSLEQTAQELWDIARNLPHREVEPWFYQ